MKTIKDPLFDIFNKHMETSLVEEESCSISLVNKVVTEYMDAIDSKQVLPQRLFQFIEDDVKEDVTQMLQKTTYGYFNLDAFQKASSHLSNKLKVRGS